MLAENCRAIVFRSALAALSEAAGELAFRIVGAGDEGPVAPPAQRQAPLSASGTEARIAAVAFVREQERREELVERRGDLRQIGRAHVRTPVPNAHLVRRLLLVKTQSITSSNQDDITIHRT